MCNEKSAKNETIYYLFFPFLLKNKKKKLEIKNTKILMSSHSSHEMKSEIKENYDGFCVKATNLRQ